MANSITRKEKMILAVRKILHFSYRISPALAGRLCYRVLTTPPKHEATQIEEAFIDESKRYYLPLGKLQAAVYHWPGKGKKVLLAHGWDSYSGRWHELGRRLLAAGCDLYAFDAPAHGNTGGGTFSIGHYAELMAAFARSYHPQLIVGHSAGGMAAIYYLKTFMATPRPEQLALLAAPAELSDFVESFRRVIGLKPEVIKALEKDFLRRWKNPFSYYSMSRFAKALEMPGLIIHDRHDDIAPFAGAHQIAANWPQADLVITEGMGHKLQTEMVWERVLNLV